MSHGSCVALPRDTTGCLQFVIVVFPDHTHLLFYVNVQLIASSGGSGETVFKFISFPGAQFCVYRGLPK